MHLNYRNVNEALPELANIVIQKGVRSDSRNGPVFTMADPLIITTMRPTERALLIPERGANPFLFLLDGLSVLTNLDLIAPLTAITPRMADFSDDGQTFRGHYGRRLYNFIPDAIEMLATDKTTRRVVMSIWDNTLDLGTNTKDVPCNLMVVPRIVSRQHVAGRHEASVSYRTAEELDLTVFNRSNDLFWGMMGANVVQFSFLQEFLARAVGVEVGRLHQVSTNLHVYTDFGPGKKLDLESIRSQNGDVYITKFGEHPPVIHMDVGQGGVPYRVFQHEVRDILVWMGNLGPQPCPTSRFLDNVVIPMMMAWNSKSTEVLKNFPDNDWFHAARIYFKEI